MMSPWTVRAASTLRSHYWLAASTPRVFSLAPRWTASCLPTSISFMPPLPLNRLATIQRHLTMNAQELQNFLADSPPTTVSLVIKKHFEALDDQQKRYAHYISKYVIRQPLFEHRLLWASERERHPMLMHSQSRLHWHQDYTPPSLTRIREHLRLHN
jgi:hypothetical protein